MKHKKISRKPVNSTTDKAEFFEGQLKSSMRDKHDADDDDDDDDDEGDDEEVGNESYEIESDYENEEEEEEELAVGGCEGEGETAVTAAAKNHDDSLSQHRSSPGSRKSSSDSLKERKRAASAAAAAGKNSSHFMPFNNHLYHQQLALHAQQSSFHHGNDLMLFNKPPHSLPPPSANAFPSPHSLFQKYHDQREAAAGSNASLNLEQFLKFQSGAVASNGQQQLKLLNQFYSGLSQQQQNQSMVGGFADLFKLSPNKFSSFLNEAGLNPTALTAAVVATKSNE